MGAGSRDLTVVGHTYPYRELALERALEELRGLGLRAIELWIGHAPDPSAAAEAIKNQGLEVAAISAGSLHDRGSRDPDRAVELAEATQSPLIVASVSEAMFAELAPSQLGGRLCVENHWDQWFATPRALESKAAREEVPVCLDTGHAILAGVAPERFVGELGGRIAHVHLKDARALTIGERLMGRRVRRRTGRRPEPIFPGTGVLRIPTLRRALDAAGYRGSISVEYEGDEPTEALAALLEMWQAHEPGA